MIFMYMVFSRAKIFLKRALEAKDATAENTGIFSREKNRRKFEEEQEKNDQDK